MSFLTVDIGTSSCRAAVVSNNGEINYLTRSSLSPSDQPPPFAEMDCDLIWKAVRQVIGRITAAELSSEIEAIGVSSFLAYVFLDADDRPLAPAILYADNRAVTQVEEILRVIPKRDLHRLTGRSPSPEALAAKLLWFKKNRPEMAGKIHKIIGLKDDIVRRLTGVVTTDLAHANYSMLFNISKNRFEADLIKDLKLEQIQFPEPAFADRVVGRLNRKASEEVGLREGLPVVLGSSDGTTAMYGGGVCHKDRAVLVSGTTDVLMMLTKDYPDVPDPALTINSGPEPNLFLSGGATGLSGGTVRKFEHLFNCSVTDLEPLLAELPPGSHGLLVLPGLSGERAPYWQESTRGAICGLSLKHGPEHIFTALIEATGFRIRRLIKALESSSLKVGAVRVTGGLSDYDHVNRIRSNITGVEMIRMAQLEATCLGTAAFCKSGLMGGGAVLDITGEWVREERRFIPDLELTKKYAVVAEMFEQYLQTVADLHGNLRTF